MGIGTVVGDAGMPPSLADGAAGVAVAAPAGMLGVADAAGIVGERD